MCSPLSTSVPTINYPSSTLDHMKFWRKLARWHIDFVYLHLPLFIWSFMSLLKRAVGPDVQVSSTLPMFSDSMQEPVKVLDRRIIHEGYRSVAQVLIQWSSWPPSMSTWEDEGVLKNRFPRALSWGQASSKDGGDVTHQDAGAASTVKAGSKEDASSIANQNHNNVPRCTGRPRSSTSSALAQNGQLKLSPRSPTPAGCLDKKVDLLMQSRTL